MERITVTFEDEDFDRAVHARPVLQDFGDLSIHVKDKATMENRPLVCLTFHVHDGDTKVRVQTVTTARNFIAAARMIEAKFPGLMA